MFEQCLPEHLDEDAETLAELYALATVVADPRKAYYYYHLHYSTQYGYLTAWQNEHEDPGVYCGPVGDFRNESMVSDLVDMLGFDECKNLDAKAQQWLSKYG